MRSMIGLMSIVALGFCLTLARAAEEKTPDATLRLSGGSVAAGVGVSWAGDVGVTKIEASGSVYNLAKLDDFDGNYTAVGAGLTAAGGASGVAMKNQNGVTVNLVSTTQGVKVAVGAGGVEMKLKH